MGAFKCDSCIHKVVCQATVDGPCIEDCALYTKDENFNSTQQLKAEIAAVSADLGRLVVNGGNLSDLNNIFNKLWQLSAF